MLTKDRLIAAIAAAAGKIAAIPAAEAKSLDEGMALEADDHFRFQTMQAEAHAGGILATDAAQVIYVALGEVGSASNGGWAARTDTATKVVVTQLMSELLGRKLGRAGR